MASSVLAGHGGWDGLVRASITELCDHTGLGQTKAIELKAVLEIGRRLASTRPAAADQVRSPHDVAALMTSKMGHLEQEHLNVILLNTKNRVIDVKLICSGSLNTAAVRMCEIYREPIRQNAAAVVLVHNHPSGDPAPSPEDIRLTADAGQAGDLLNIELLDHVVIGREGFVSLKERGLGFARRSRDGDLG
jgi:DNA repair protein RadC